MNYNQIQQKLSIFNVLSHFAAESRAAFYGGFAAESRAAAAAAAAAGGVGGWQRRMLEEPSKSASLGCRAAWSECLAVGLRLPPSGQPREPGGITGRRGLLAVGLLLGLGAGIVATAYARERQSPAAAAEDQGRTCETILQGLGF